MQAAVKTEIVVDLDYEACGHRYLPKLWVADTSAGDCSDSKRARDRGIFARLASLISRERNSCLADAGDIPAPHAKWTSIAPDRYKVDGKGEGEIWQARLTLTADSMPQIVSSQELLLPADYEYWLDQLETKSSVQRSMLGRSLEGSPIELVKIVELGASPRDQLFVVGRQHPPEVTGGFALFAFTERLLEDDPLARTFRAKVETSIVPLLNPDGVVRGHWRHSQGERDLNRDWGPFTQPETRLVRDKLQMLEVDPTRELRFFMDFHSTGRDVLYTLDKSLETNPPALIEAWVEDYRSRLPGYEVEEEPGHNPERPVSKAWVYERFGVPAMTYEIGDETDRDLINKLGRAAAEATMVTMLGYDAQSD
jgi:predicted deacylase